MSKEWFKKYVPLVFGADRAKDFIEPYLGLDPQQRGTSGEAYNAPDTRPAPDPNTFIYDGTVESMAPATEGSNVVGNNPADALAPSPEEIRRAQQANEALGIKNRLLGRGGEVDSIVNEIVGAITSMLEDQKKRRQDSYDSEVAALLDSFNTAQPNVEKAFASLGLSNSTFVGDRLKDVRDEWSASQEASDEQFKNDLAGYGSVAQTSEAEIRGEADKAKNSLNYIKDAEANADNLGKFQETEYSFNNALTDLGTQKAKYGTQGEFLEKLKSIGGDYDFSKTLDAFGDFAGSAAQINNPNSASRTAAEIRGIGEKNKKKLTEVETNNPVGAAAA